MIFLEITRMCWKHLREKIQYLMVDEYQDTNSIQEQILFLLCQPNNNLCVVGDDDQGLYRFRGATIRNILEFPSKFASGTCQQVRLVTNYRSHPQIVSFYNQWMRDQEWEDRGVTFRYPKEIVAKEGAFPEVHRCSTSLQLRQKGVPPAGFGFPTASQDGRNADRLESGGVFISFG